MTRSTVRAVNRAIAARSIAAELVAGHEYFYFIGAAVERAPSTSVMVARVSHLTVGAWLDELTRILDTVPPVIRTDDIAHTLADIAALKPAPARRVRQRNPLANLRTRTDILHRRVDCPECGRVFSIARRGIPGGALAAASRLRGQLFKHLEEKHPGWRNPRPDPAP